MDRFPGENSPIDAPIKPPRRKITLIEVVVTFTIILVLVALFSPAKRSAGEATRRTTCINHLKNIGLALHNYAWNYGVFPPAYTVDANGKPLHSWRTLILPYLDHQRLYEKIDLTKPWNDPVNAEAYATEVWAFQCLSAKLNPHETTYLAVTTETSFFQPTQPREFSDVIDDPYETLLVIDAPVKNAVHWMAPLDADEQLVLGLAHESDLQHPGISIAVFADGTVRTISPFMPRSEFQRLISIAGDDAQITPLPAQE